MIITAFLVSCTGHAYMLMLVLALFAAWGDPSYHCLNHAHCHLCWLINNNQYQVMISIITKKVLAHCSWQNDASDSMLLAQQWLLVCLKTSAGLQTHNKQSLQEWHEQQWAVQGAAVMLYLDSLICAKHCQWLTDFCQSAVSKWQMCPKKRQWVTCLRQKLVNESQIPVKALMSDNFVPKDYQWVPGLPQSSVNQ